MREPVPLVLKFENWPEADRAMWTALFANDDFFDDNSLVDLWSAGTRRKREQGYGQWLSFLVRQYPDALATEPLERISPGRVRSYHDECTERLKLKSTYGLILDLYAIGVNLDRSRDWSWLRLLANRLRIASERQSLPPPKPLTAPKIYQWSRHRLEEVHALGKPNDVMTAVDYRDALMIGFLIARPIRRRALLTTRIGQHLRRTDEGYQLRFGADDIKDRKPRSFSLPRGLVDPMALYLSDFRPTLLGSNVTDAVWISRRGNPTSGDTLARYLPIVTERHLGVPLRPHAFRHIAATSIAEMDPEHVNIIRDILGHATLDMSQKHYNRATGIECCNTFQSLVDSFPARPPKNIGIAESRLAILPTTSAGDREG